MINFSKLNVKLSILAFGIIGLSSCEKDTGDVGLGTLPPDDGFYVFEDTIKLTGFNTVVDSRAYTEDQAAIMIGSVVEKLDETRYDTVVAECDIPLFFPQNPGAFSKMTSPHSLSLVFKDYGNKVGGYKYGDTLHPVAIDIWGNIGGKDEIIGSFDYSYEKNSGYRKNDTVTIPLGNELMNYIVEGIKNTLANVPVDSIGYYPADTNIIAKQYFFANYFKGIKLRVKNPADAFVARIFNPYILLEYKDSSVYLQEFIFQRYDLQLIDSVAVDSGIFAYPGALFRHSSSLNATAGAFVQGGSSSRTIIDMSPIASWKDSATMLVNKATIRFEADIIDNRPPIGKLRLTMYNTSDKTLISTADMPYVDSLNSYFFEINRMLNTFIKNGIPLENYEFELACPMPNTTVNKTLIKYKDGINLNVVYSKY